MSEKKIPLEMKRYMKTFTYLDARMYDGNREDVRKRIRYAMPKYTLQELKENQVS